MTRCIPWLPAGRCGTVIVSLGLLSRARARRGWRGGRFCLLTSHFIQGTWRSMFLARVPRGSTVDRIDKRIPKDHTHIGPGKWDRARSWGRATHRRRRHPAATWTGPTSRPHTLDEHRHNYRNVPDPVHPVPTHPRRVRGPTGTTPYPTPFACLLREPGASNTGTFGTMRRRMPRPARPTELRKREVVHSTCRWNRICY
jgi:hypothetical protein